MPCQVAQHCWLTTLVIILTVLLADMPFDKAANTKPILSANKPCISIIIIELAHDVITNTLFNFFYWCQLLGPRCWTTMSVTKMTTDIVSWHCQVVWHGHYRTSWRCLQPHDQDDCTVDWCKQWCKCTDRREWMYEMIMDKVNTNHITVAISSLLTQQHQLASIILKHTQSEWVLIQGLSFMTKDHDRLVKYQHSQRIPLITKSHERLVKFATFSRCLIKLTSQSLFLIACWTQLSS